MKTPNYHKIEGSLFFGLQLYSLKIEPHDRNAVAYKKEWIDNYREKYVQFINSLIKLNDKITYEIRIVNSLKDSNQNSLSIYFLIRIDEDNSKNCEHIFYSLINNFNNLFPEYKYKVLSGSEVEKLLMPINDFHYISSINRRVISDQLDTLKSTIKEIGFFDSKTQKDDAEFLNISEENRITYIFPFVFQYYDTQKFFSHFYFINKSFILSIKLKPADLLYDEEKFLEDQIIKCEKFAQVNISSSTENLSQISPTLQTLSRSYQNNLIKFLFNLKSSCGILTINILTKEIPDLLFLNSLAQFFTTRPKDNLNIEDFLRGGYELTTNEIDEKQLSEIFKLELLLHKNELLDDKNYRLQYLFDSFEASTAFRLPSSALDILTNFDTFIVEERFAPVVTHLEGCLIGLNTFHGEKKEIKITAEDRKRHVYIIGQTGTGKSTLLKTMILNDIKQGNGLCLIDPHGDLYRQILGYIPENRIDDVVLIDPTDKNYPVGINLLEYKDPEHRYFIVQEFIGILKRLIEGEYGTKHSEYAGPIFYLHTRNNLLLVMSDPDNKGTLIDFYFIFQIEDYWRQWQDLKLKDPLLENWVKHVLPVIDYQSVKNDSISLGDYITSKFQNFFFDPLLRNILSQKKSTIDFADIMNNKKILLINLAKGELTEENSRFLGMLIMTKIMTAAMERSKLPISKRTDFFVYVDEFQNIAINSFTTLISEARKFGVYLILANQFLNQIHDEKITLSLFGNVGTLISFRIGQDDAKLLEQKFYPYLTSFHLTNLPNWSAYVSTLVNGQSTPPFNIETILENETYSSDIAKKVIEHSRRKYSKKIDKQ